MSILNVTNQNSFASLLSSDNKTGTAAKKDNEQAKIAQTAEDFEAFFITRSMESMYEGVSTDSMFGGGNAEKIYRSMLLNEYGKSMAKTGNVGVKDEILRSILEMQEKMSQETA